MVHSEHAAGVDVGALVCWLGLYSVVAVGAGVRAGGWCCGWGRRSRTAWPGYPVAGAARQPRFRSGGQWRGFAVVLRNRGCVKAVMRAVRGWGGRPGSSVWGGRARAGAVAAGGARD